MLCNLAYLGEKEEHAARMVREAAISHRVSIFGPPGISIVDSDVGFIGETLQGCSAGRSLVLQTVIRVAHRCLGATARRPGLFRGIIEQLMEKGKITSTEKDEWAMWIYVRFPFKFTSAVIRWVYTWPKSLWKDT